MSEAKAIGPGAGGFALCVYRKSREEKSIKKWRIMCRVRYVSSIMSIKMYV